ncbi:cellulase family glycosylhydrolase [Labilibaculum manganireducens]|uniref:glycoside hydrolase 5 family protein n=1 Tax=Labilibaculum manganireducens TaxID=1940525 RepID=UPI0029F4BD63|nr:cellulase family glycosylhydrolase [Labilibaculum manganireducens]
MNKTLLFLLAGILIVFSACQQKNEANFVKVANNGFTLNGKEYSFKGANYWQGMNLGAPQSGDQQRLVRELDEMQELGITNLRILAASEADSAMRYCIHPALQTAPGVYNNDIWQGLDFLLAEMGKREMKAVMVLGNFWTWSGGFPQYLRWAGMGEVPYPQEPPTSWQQFTDYSKQFFSNDSAQEMMKNHIKTIIGRINSITGKAYKDDAVIMAWQLANEPRGYDVPKQLQKWTRATSGYIKSLDSNHLVCLGTEGNTADLVSGVNVLIDNDDSNIDYITMHIWAQNWGWYSPEQSDSVYTEMLQKVNSYWDVHVDAAKKLQKPIVLEEFGIARDGSSFSPDTTTNCRDRFFEFIFSKVDESIKNNGMVRGVNFWSYSGEGRPPHPGEFWEKGDTYLGDPPHELQGWYGVYDKDSTTLAIIKRCCESKF